MTQQRQTQSKTKIYQALVTLLKKYSFDKISVADITRLAGVNRGTFYLHYLDKFDLIDQVVKEVTDHLYDTLLSAPQEIDRPIQEVLDYIKQNQDLILTLSQSSAINLSKELNAFMMTLQERVGIQGDTYQLISISGSVAAVIKHWLTQGCQESVEEMAQLIFDLRKRYGLEESTEHKEATYA